MLARGPVPTPGAPSRPGTARPPEPPSREDRIAGLCRTVVLPLRRLAEQRRTGRLRILTGRQGSLFLVDGRVSRAAAMGVPTAELGLLREARRLDRWRREVGAWPDGVLDTGRADDLARRVLEAGDVPPPHSAVLLERAVADAAWGLLGRHGDPAADLQFQPGARARWELREPQDVETVLDEALRRDELLADRGHGTHPDLPVWRAPEPPGPVLRLSGRQWDLICLAEGRSPRQLAWLTAEGLFATTLDVARMRALDLLVPRPVG